MARVYFWLCVIGTVLPLSSFLPWFGEHALDLPLFAAELFANPISSFAGWDLIVSALVLFVFVAVEGGRLKVKPIWAPVVATLAVGVSLGLPLFLLLREIRLQQIEIESMRADASVPI
jgi:hypothetical protein